MKNEILHLFFANKTNKEQEQNILDWLDQHPENYQKFLEERNLFDQIIMSEKRVRRSRFSILSNPMLISSMKYAAIFVVAVGISTAIDYQKRKELMSVMTTITTPSGQRLNLTLPDGTKVEMNALSTIEYPAVFSDKERIVKLDGEVYFEVESNKDRPFIVETKLCDIEVLGTKFNVEAYSGDASVTTSLIEGKVNVIENRTDQNIVLRPNHMVICKQNKLYVEKIDNSNYLSWRNGIFAFKGEEFNSLIVELERHYGVTIALAPDFQIPDISFTGKIRISDGLNHAMKLLQSYTDFSYTYNQKEDNLVVLHN